MNTNRKTFNRHLTFGTALALALAVAFAVPASAQTADDVLLPERGISVVPVETPEAEAAAEIAALANGDGKAEVVAVPGEGEAEVVEFAGEGEAEVGAEVAATEAPADPAAAVIEPFVGAENPADVYEHLLGAGYDVSVVRRDYQGSYVFLVKTEHAAQQVLILVNAAGEVVDHRRVEAAAHAPAYAPPARTYAPAHRAAAYQNCQQPSAGYQGGYANQSRQVRY